MGQKGSGLGHVTYFSKFWTPDICGMAKIRNSNFASRLRIRDTEPKNENLVKRERSLGHVTYFSNFGTSPISLEWLKIQTSNLSCRLIVSVLNK